MSGTIKKIQLLVLLVSLFTPSFSQHKEEEYYSISTLPIPKDIVLEVGGILTLPNGSLAASTRHGEIWVIDHPSTKNDTLPVFKKFASGMHEVLGLAYKDSSFYVVQRSELTKLTDVDKDGKADRYETIYRWPITGNYHEYSYGPSIAPDGSFFVTTNVGFEDFDPLRARSTVPWRGWTLKISENGKMEPWATGMRSPCGYGWINGDFFYADNQGDWIGSGGLVHVEKGDFTGNPGGLVWADQPNSPVTVRKKDIYSRVDPQLTPPNGPYPSPYNVENGRGKRLYEIAAEVPGVKIPAVWIPHGVLGTSLTEIFTDQTNGKFGPFAGQVFIGDMGQSRINRIFLEKVNGVYQGAVIDFRSGFESGVLRFSWSKDGELYVGQTNRGWGGASAGAMAYGIQSLKWTGKIPFEMKTVRAMPDGFEIGFTLPVNKTTAADTSSYSIMHFLYKYHPAYGSPVVDEGNSPVKAVVVSDDGMFVRLVVDSLKKKLIHEIKLEGVTAASDNQPLLHNTAYYTLNEIPEGMKLVLNPIPARHHQHPVTTEKNTVKTPSSVTAKKPAETVVKRQVKMPEHWKAPDQTISLGTKQGLKFDQEKIIVKAGSKIKWVFQNKDDMMHNCVIVQPGTAVAVGEQALKLGVQGNKLNYIPNSKNVLFHTNIVAPGTNETIYFEAPEKPGTYTFVCTYPGHYLIMQGTLEVVR